MYVTSNTGWSDSLPYNDTFFGNATMLAGRRFRLMYLAVVGTEPGVQSAFAVVGGQAFLVRTLLVAVC
jgi:hypothetical protein